jgi:signal transduction histidine kinase/ligand-binding sensor domain-containing protein
VALVCLLSAVAAWPLIPEPKTVNLNHTFWGAKDGAPAGGVAYLAQATDGYLWMATWSGKLFRFDGRRFERIELPRSDRLNSMSVYSIFAPQSGGLWFGFTFSGVGFLKDGKMTVYTEDDGLPSGSVKEFAQGPDGTLWALASGGLARLGAGGWQRVEPKSHVTPNLNALIVDTEGNLWVSGIENVFVLPKGETELQQIELPFRGMVSVYESRSGTLWIQDADEIRPFQKINNSGERGVYSGRGTLIARDGAMWIGPNQGAPLMRVSPADELPSSAPIRLADQNNPVIKRALRLGTSANSALEDREGNVWIASAKGLDRFSQQDLTREFETGGNQPGIAAADSGGVWVSYRLARLPIAIFENDRLVPQATVHGASCVLRADDGSIWFGSQTAVSHYIEGRFTQIASPFAGQGFEVQAMAQEQSGALWVVFVRKGVFRLDHGAWTEIGNLTAFPNETHALSMVTDSIGNVWLGYIRNTVAVARRGMVQVYGANDGLQLGNVTALYGRRTKLWAGGEFGLAFFDGEHFQSVIPEPPLRIEGITGIVETESGDLWLNGSSGIVYITAAELRHSAEAPSTPVHGEMINSLDGLEGLAEYFRPLPSVIEGIDGRLWFATNSAVFSLDPQHFVRSHNSVVPPVVIEALSVGDKSYPPTPDLRLPENTTALRIRYVGLSLTMPERVRYRYKLKGVNQDWQDAQERDIAYFTNLSPGRYHFQVIASNNDGVWNEKGATLDFLIPPMFTQTTWFYVVCAVSGGALIALLFRFRLRQLAARMRMRLNERLRERERIARELHDTLLQSTQGLMLRVQAVRNRALPEDPIREALDGALKRADEVLAEARDRVQDLRIPTEARSDLGSSLKAAGEELALGRAVEFRVVIEGSSRKLRSEIVEEVYCVGREALRNAFHHAQASAIELLIMYGTRDLHVVVHDDGCGIDSDILNKRSRAGHWGLKGMRERAQQIDAHLEIRSRSGSGTEVDLLVPSAFIRARRQWIPSWIHQLRVRRGPG